MHFELSDFQQEIQRTARDLLASRATPDRVREHAEAGTTDDGLWGELVALGWPGIAVAEAHGGQGLGLVELAILAEELGAVTAPVPLLGSALAALLVEHAADDAQRAAWLPKLAAGQARGAVGAAGSLIPDAAGADVVVLLDAAGGATLVEGPFAETRSIDPTRRHALVAPGTEGEPLTGDVQAGVDRAAVVVAAELAGVCRRALEMSIAYVKDRRQFDTPVGAYQAVSHTAAQMLRDAEGARAATFYAAWAADASPEALPQAAAMAKATASDAGRNVTASAIQLHGGIGFTWEADVHWLFKRAQLDSVLLGDAKAHRARLARLVVASRPAA